MIFIVILEAMLLVMAALIIGWSVASRKVPKGILEWVIMIAGALVWIKWMLGK